MKKINLILVAAVALIATSCTTYSYTTRSIKINKQNFDATSAFVDIVPDYSRRIMAESGKHKTSSAAQEEARFNAIVENNIDVLVDPIYKVTKSGKKYTAQVVGFAGFYKNNRNFYEDLERLKNVDLKEIEKYLLLKDPSLLPMIKGEPCNGKPREGNVREGDVINIYHNSDAPHHDDKAPAKQQPKAQPQPQPQPQAQPQAQPQPQPQAQPQPQQEQPKVEAQPQKPQNNTYNQSKNRSRSNKSSNRSGSKK